MRLRYPCLGRIQTRRAGNYRGESGVGGQRGALLREHQADQHDEEGGDDGEGRGAGFWRRMFVLDDAEAGKPRLRGWRSRPRGRKLGLRGRKAERRRGSRTAPTGPRPRCVWVVGDKRGLEPLPRCPFHLAKGRRASLSPSALRRAGMEGEEIPLSRLRGRRRDNGLCRLKPAASIGGAVTRLALAFFAGEARFFVPQNDIWSVLRTALG